MVTIASLILASEQNDLLGDYAHSDKLISQASAIMDANQLPQITQQQLQSFISGGYTATYQGNIFTVQNQQGRQYRFIFLPTR